MAEAEKTKENIESEHQQKRFLDKDTVFHLLFGCGLGLVLGLLIDIFVLALILGIILIPIFEYSVHRVITGYATLKSKNALVDLLFAGLGVVILLLIIQFE
ncbi:MAG: hypothetical protein ACFFHV_20760 [Promethearchaeota archaeon]